MIGTNFHSQLGLGSGKDVARISAVDTSHFDLLRWLFIDLEGAVLTHFRHPKWVKTSKIHYQGFQHVSTQ